MICCAESILLHRGSSGYSPAGYRLHSPNWWSLPLWRKLTMSTT